MGVTMIRAFLASAVIQPNLLFAYYDKTKCIVHTREMSRIYLRNACFVSTVGRIRSLILYN